jgi:hypothetical protein
VGQGDLLSTDKMSVRIRYAKASHRDLARVLLCVDSEGEDIARRQSAIDSVVGGVGPLKGLAVRGVVVDRSPEGWILCDRQAVASYLSLSQSGLKYPNPEGAPRPVQHMERLFRIANRDYTKTHDLPRLANIVNPEIIARSSPTFQLFHKALTA